jgi:hypothetical protein
VDYLSPGPEWWRPCLLNSTADEDAGSQRASQGSELESGARLANAGFPGEEHQPPLARHSRFETGQQRVYFSLPPDKDGFQAVR